MKFFKLFENWNGEAVSEAKLSGTNSRSNFQPGILQTFHRYVQESPKQDPTSGKYIDFSTESDAELYKIGSGKASGELEPAGIKLKKGTDGIIITIKNTTELVQVPIYKKDGSLSSTSPKYYVPIKYNNKEYLIALSDLRKPTGKAVEEWKPDLTSAKTGGDRLRPFTPGHPQEAEICQMFVDNTTADWQFKYNEHIYEVMLIGGANYDGKGHPKTDIELQLSCASDPAHVLKNKHNIQRYIKDGQYKVSLKDKSANFVEGWISPERALDILGKDLQPQLQKIWNSIKNSDQKTLKGFKKRGSSGNTAALFIGVKDSGYFEWDGKKHSSSVDKWPLPPKALMEAYAGAEKFKGKHVDAIANSFYKGKTPKNPTEFLDNLIPVNEQSIKKNMEALYIQPQLRNNPSSKSAIFANKIKGKWELNDNWLSRAGLKGKIK